jgi:hypothetical protein
MRGDYLYYEEKIETTQEEKEAKAARRFVQMLHSSVPENERNTLAGQDERVTPLASFQVLHAAETAHRKRTA